MPSLKDIRVRIDSTKNTQQITRAMKMVAAAKLRRAQHNIVNLRPYAHSIMGVIANIAATRKVEHPLLSRTEHPQRLLLVVLNSDRGLCGAFNGNVAKYTEQFLKANGQNYEKVDILFVGRKVADYFRRRGVKPLEVILNLAKDISYDLAAGVAARIMDSYRAGHYDEVRFVYNEFKSAIQQSVVSETMLPIDIDSFSSIIQGIGGFPPEMIFEPDPASIIEQFVSKHFNVQVYRCLSESIAAEHGARMTAMENATKNAGEMIHSLTLTYNKARQAAITKELIEITSGAEALKA